MQAAQISNVIKEVVLKTLNAWLKLSLPLSETRDLLVALIPYSNYALLCEVSLLNVIVNNVSLSELMFPIIQLVLD